MLPEYVDSPQPSQHDTLQQAHESDAPRAVDKSIDCPKPVQSALSYENQPEQQSHDAHHGQYDAPAPAGLIDNTGQNRFGHREGRVNPQRYKCKEENQAEPRRMWQWRP